MSYKNRKGWIVSIRHNYPGVSGSWIHNCQEYAFQKIVKQIERQKALKGIPDEEIVLEEHPFLKTLDPKLWKDQDHYAVLGLPKLRNRATPSQIKFAYRKAVLKHHPDKRRREGEDAQNDSDDYFTCITKAYETLGNSVSRRSYDSIDPTFDDDIPSKNLKSDFFKTYSLVFDRNSRWSIDDEVPHLGDKYSSVEEVDRFYNFWFNFNSWREYSYLDEENKDKAEDAYERRWMDKQNKAARATRKKEENQRIRQLVENAYACDPRIKRFKEEEKRRKDQEKREKAEANKRAREKQAEEERKKQEEKEREKMRLMEEEKKKKLEAKKMREQEKKMKKEESKKLQAFCEERNYFDMRSSAKFDFIDKINHLCIDLSLLDLQGLNKKIDDAPNEARTSIEQEIKKLKDKVEQTAQSHSSGGSKAQNGHNKKDDANWPFEELQVLIKAVNLFPAGTANRWQVVATYVNTHSKGKEKTSKECLARAKNLKESELKQEVNKKAFEKFQQKHSVVTVAPSDGSISTRQESRSWTGDEQKRLEQALKTFPASTEQRWDKISDAVSGRTKRECMLRYKELVEMVRAKKAINQQSKKS